MHGQHGGEVSQAAGGRLYVPQVPDLTGFSTFDTDQYVSLKKCLEIILVKNIYLGLNMTNKC